MATEGSINISPVVVPSFLPFFLRNYLSNIVKLNLMYLKGKGKNMYVRNQLNKDYMKIDPRVHREQTRNAGKERSPVLVPKCFVLEIRGIG